MEIEADETSFIGISLYSKFKKSPDRIRCAIALALLNLYKNYSLKLDKDIIEYCRRKNAAFVMIEELKKRDVVFIKEKVLRWTCLDPEILKDTD